MAGWFHYYCNGCNCYFASDFEHEHPYCPSCGSDEDAQKIKEDEDEAEY